MITDIIHLGDKVDFCLVQQMAQEQKTGVSPKIYKSQVNDIGDNGDIEVTMPIENGKVRLLPLGVRYEFVFYAKTGLYHCIGQIKERCKKDNIYVLVVEIHSQMEKFQRRQYYRYPCLIDAEFYPITEEDAEKNSTEDILNQLRDDQFYEKKKFCKVVDVSGEGVRIIAEEKLQVGSFLLLILKLTNEVMDTQHYIMGHVLTSEVLKGYTDKFEIRIQFIFKDNKIREEIIKYIFEEERKDRNSEL